MKKHPWKVSVMSFLLILLHGCAVDDPAPDEHFMPRSTTRVNIDTDLAFQSLRSRIIPESFTRGEAAHNGDDPLADFDWSDALHFEDEQADQDFYTLKPIVTPEDGDPLENLVLSKSYGIEAAFIMRYLPNRDWAESHDLMRDIDSYVGKIEYYTLSGEKMGHLLFEDDLLNGARANTGCYTVVVELGTFFDTQTNEDGIMVSEIHFKTRTATICPISLPDNLPEILQAPEQGGGGLLPVFPQVGNIPCPGDPLPNPQVTPTMGSGKKGGTFGMTRSGGTQRHDGIDITAVPGTDIYPILGGKVIWTKDSFLPDEYEFRSYGNGVIVETTLPNGDRIRLRYNHMNTINVSENQIIDNRTILGSSGRTGNAAASGVIPHLHVQGKKISNGVESRMNPADVMHTAVSASGQTLTPPCLTF